MSDHAEHHLPTVPELQQIAHLFPGYEIAGLIASGGMGVVYKARQVSLDRDVAIKLLPREFGADAEFRNSFEAEAKAMARLNHPNLISVFDFGEVDELLFIIMEFVPGKSLFHSAHGTAIEPSEAGGIVANVCEGLAHAHEHGILHRDVKPGNILLSPKAEPKIGDFGLARPVNKEHNPDETIFGTPGYTAPEVISHPDRVDPRADIFSAGVILHELLAGKLPDEDPHPPSRISGSDPRFDTIVRRATHPNPEMRYPDAATMAKEVRELVQALAGPKLRTVAGGKPGRNLPPPRTTRSLRPVVPQKSNAAAVWIAFVAVACIAAVLALVFRPDEGPAPAKAPPKPASSASPAVPRTKPKNNRPKRPKNDRTRPDRIAAGDENPDPGPMPEPEPEPIATTDPEPQPEPEPEPEPVPSGPKLDTVAWFDMARIKMQEKAHPVLDEHEEALERNLDSFQRGVNRCLRRLDKDQRDRAEESSDDWFDSLREQDKRIPAEFKTIDDKFKHAKAVVPRIRSEYGEAKAKQQSIDQQLATEMRALTGTYILGIEMRIQRLAEQDDPIAIEILQADIDATRERPERFERMMRGLDPDPPPPEGEEGEEGEDGKKKKRDKPGNNEPEALPPPATPD